MSIFDKAKDVAQGAKMFAGLLAREYNGVIAEYHRARDGICRVCNNLQPNGHPRTFGRPGGDTVQWNPVLAARRKEVGVVPTLYLEDINPKDILQSREVDPQTGEFKRDCRYCRLLCDVFDHFFIDEWMSWVTEVKNGMPVKVGLMIRQGEPLVVNCWEFEYDKWWKTSRCDLELYMDPMPAVPIPGAPSLGPTGRRPADVRSDESLWFMKDSLSECCHQHPRCAAKDTDFVPTRLVYIGRDNNSLRLHETTKDDIGKPWVALSHCWGGSTPLSLKQGNIGALKKRILWTDLPNTFKDGITLARHLNIFYIWIDCLCIVQDSENGVDWQREAARMGSVYQNAFIVISTSSSKSAEVPVLKPREQDWLPKQFEFEYSPGHKIPIMARKRAILAAPLEQGLLEPPFTESWVLKRVGPIYSRGWCFQESHLAPRILHFTPGAIIFECQTHRRREDQLPPYTSTVPGTLGEVGAAEQWRYIVKSYTGRQLTRASDRLPAISGAADKMPQRATSRYLAGLWSETLIFDLMWQLMPFGWWDVLVYGEEESRAPTWSWASMRWGVSWDNKKVNSAIPVATVLDAQTTVPGENPLGEVTGGSITLRGRLTWCYLEALHSQKEHWLYRDVGNGVKSDKTHFRTDGALKTHTSRHFYQERQTARREPSGRYDNERFVTNAAVFFLAKQSRVLGIYVGLVLGLSPKVEGCWERVGLVWFVPTAWYNAGQETTVTIL